MLVFAFVGVANVILRFHGCKHSDLGNLDYDKVGLYPSNIVIVYTGVTTA